MGNKLTEKVYKVKMPMNAKYGVEFKSFTNGKPTYKSIWFKTKKERDNYYTEEIL